MKKIVFAGFCMVSGLLLLWLAMTEGFYVNVNFTPLVTVLSILLFVGGFSLGVIGLKKE